MRIGIAVDGSSPSRAAVELVASLPLSGSDHVSVISAAPPPVLLGAAPFGHVPSVSGFLELMATASEDRARMVAAHAVERLIGLPCPVTPIVLLGHPVERLTRVATEDDLDLLVLGPRGAGGMGSVLLGSVSQSLLHAMPTSILIARPPTEAPMRVILAADGSPASAAAAAYLAGFPLPARVDLRVLVSVTAGSEEYRGIEAPDWFAQGAEERRRALVIANEMMRILAREGRICSPIIRDGDPKREILDAALEQDADLIVTGARGLGGFKGLVLGSVSRGVSKAAPCSVLVVGGPKAVALPAGEVVS
jgi:nucleotide-binding universal stress UspA family protein